MLKPSLVSVSPAAEPLPGSAAQQLQLRQPGVSGRRRGDEQPADRHPPDHPRPGLVPRTGDGVTCTAAGPCTDDSGPGAQSRRTTALVKHLFKADDNDPQESSF